MTRQTQGQFVPKTGKKKCALYFRVSEISEHPTVFGSLVYYLIFPVLYTNHPLRSQIQRYSPDAGLKSPAVKHTSHT